MTLKPEAMSLNRNSSPSPVSEQFATPTDGPNDLSSSFNAKKSAGSSSPITRAQLYATRIPGPWVTPICGASAGMASGFVTCPLDVIKTKLQAQGGFQNRRNGKIVPSSLQYRGMMGTARTIWREEGLRGMYRGLGPMLLGYLPTWAVYLTVYDRSREFWFIKCGQCSHPTTPVHRVC
jgi:solute carrier family 25 (mitochondrial folate transporter), member 32